VKNRGFKKATCPNGSISTRASGEVIDLKNEPSFNILHAADPVLGVTDAMKVYDIRHVAQSYVATIISGIVV
jgi:hypothetical protein